MKKTLIIISSIIGALIIILLICYICFSTIFGSILTSTFGVKTTVSNTTLTYNHLRFWQLQVNNPPRTKEPHALTIGRLTIVAPLSTYFTKDIQISDIELNNLVLTVEILPGNKRYTNWDEIINHMSRASPPSTKKTRDTTIRRLTINNITVRVVDSYGKVKTTKIKNLTFKNLSTKHGDITSQITKTIILRMMLNIKGLTDIPVQITNETLKGFFKGFEFKIGPGSNRKN